MFDGPFVLRRWVKGLRLDYIANHRATRRPHLRRLTAFSTAGLDEMLALLKDGRLDAAQPPSAVNLPDRLSALGLHHRGRLGWDTIRLDLSGIPRRQVRLAAAASVDRVPIEHGLVRDGGRVTNTLDPSPGPSGTGGPFDISGGGSATRAHIGIAVPAGDEQLGQMARIIRSDLSTAGAHVELFTAEPEIVYGRWRRRGPAGAALLRVAGTPGLRAPGHPSRSMKALPLFQVADYLTWRNGVGGLRVNPTVAGALYDTEDWFVTRRR